MCIQEIDEESRDERGKMTTPVQGVDQGVSRFFLAKFLISFFFFGSFYGSRGYYRKIVGCLIPLLDKILFSFHATR